MMDARATRVHVESAGQGRPLVMLHGWALHAGLFAPLMALLAQSHRVHAVDLPGHGHSTPLRPWTLDAVVAALERTFAVEDRPLDILGWSLGGMVAMAWARAHPRRIGRLVLVGTTPKFVADATWPHAMAPHTLQRFADDLRVAYKATLQRFLSLQVQGSDAGRATLASLRQQLFARGEPDAAVLGDALATLVSADLRGEVAGICAPALVIAGERDMLAPRAASAWLARSLPCARHIELAGAAHVPFLSHRAPFVAAVREFLGDG